MEVRFYLVTFSIFRSKVKLENHGTFYPHRAVPVRWVEFPSSWLLLQSSRSSRALDDFRPRKRREETCAVQWKICLALSTCLFSSLHDKTDPCSNIWPTFIVDNSREEYSCAFLEPPFLYYTEKFFWKTNALGCGDFDSIFCCQWPVSTQEWNFSSIQLCNLLCWNHKTQGSNSEPVLHYKIKQRQFLPPGACTKNPLRPCLITAGKASRLPFIQLCWNEADNF